MTEFIYWFVPLVIFMLSPALIPIIIHVCGHVYDKVGRTAESPRNRRRLESGVVRSKSTGTFRLAVDPPLTQRFSSSR
ncbi:MULTISPECIES: hypothetical protein [Rhodococcus]|uniref:hypothetical protein n=1 Tax=Rhodococcus TaxID=1827 RepID=UPI0029541E02|nr:MULTISPECIES: hypothetical protein [Rhodococcus]MDV7246589.1 hypothetical protein [Rhodococcus oxybenzonivorans]MDV7337601.1 hypothetical protein [Rhodococcus oxybenzonivorans]MDV8031389.1 hypothetical protein [Rhodococcus sp. IEGM 27]